MAEVRLCDLGCCEIMDGQDDKYSICAECGNDEGHEHGKPCSFCGSSGLSAEVLGAREEAARQELNKHAEDWIQQAQSDPRQQRYLKNGRTGRVIRTNEAVHRAIENKDPLLQISYAEALDLFRQERALSRQGIARKARRKTAKQSRKRNR